MDQGLDKVHQAYVGCVVGDYTKLEANPLTASKGFKEAEILLRALSRRSWDAAGALGAEHLDEKLALERKSKALDSEANRLWHVALQGAILQRDLGKGDPHVPDDELKGFAYAEHYLRTLSIEVFDTEIQLHSKGKRDEARCCGNERRALLMAADALSLAINTIGIYCLESHEEQDIQWVTPICLADFIRYRRSHRFGS
ncbi:MAG: hypothetical protein ACYTBJ_00245 [Planctomycetota bacterium]|jgi:hypothetical protein